MNKNTPILVTGAAGFIGSHLVEALLRDSRTVIGVDNLSSGTKKNMTIAFNHEKFEFVYGDIRDQELLTKLIKKNNIQTIYHQAAIASVEIGQKNPGLVHDVNLTGTLNILKTASKSSVKRVIFASSASVYGNRDTPVSEEEPYSPESVYAATKVGGEIYCRVFSLSNQLQTVSLRYFNVYGPRQANTDYSGVISIFINSALSKKPLVIHGSGNQIRDFISVHDVVRANILAGTTQVPRYSVFNVASNTKTTIKRIAELIQQDLGLLKKPKFSGIRKGDIAFSLAHIEKIKKALNWTPEVKLREGLQETIKWYKRKNRKV